MIKKVIDIITKNNDTKIILLRNTEVIQWLYGDLSFLPLITKTSKHADELKYKELEDRWGQTVLKIRRPDLKLEKQWTNKFGEHIAEELLLLSGKESHAPTKKEHYQPDLEVVDSIIEVKTGTYHTTGTAGEKILGSPFKYADIPQLYGKPLKILCIGGAERACREQYGNLPGKKCTDTKKTFIDFFKKHSTLVFI